MLSRKYFMRQSVILIAALSLIHFSCAENPDEDKAKSTTKRLTIYSGNNQSERVEMFVPDSLVVKVGDILGNPYEGTIVYFSTDDSEAYVEPATAISNSEGLAKCRFRLGVLPGTQHVTARIESDTTIFAETAVEPECDEESAGKSCQWPEGHIFIATTSSSLLSGNGTVVLDFDPENPGDIEKIYETSDELKDIAFSSRGELFCATREKIMKLDPTTHITEDFCMLSGDKETRLDANPGGILAGITRDGPFTLLCPPVCVTEFFSPGTFLYIKWEAVGVDPERRDLYFISGQGPLSYNLYRVKWDGRTIPSSSSSVELYKILNTSGAAGAEPKGMCFDEDGNIYISFDSQSYKNPFRRIVRVAPDGSVDYEFFDFFAYGGNNDEAGRWGDITYSNGNLYLIDRRNDRLVVISKDGEWLNAFYNDAFSMPSVENELYSIEAVPQLVCP